MEDDEAHPVEHTLLDRRRDVVCDVVVEEVAPPGQHVGRLEDRVVEAVTRLVERRGPNLHALAEVLADRAGDRLVHPVRIDRAHGGVGSLDAVLAPDGDADRPLVVH